MLGRIVTATVQPQCSQHDSNKRNDSYFHCIRSAQQALSIRPIGSTNCSVRRGITPPVTLVPGWVDLKGDHIHGVLLPELVGRAIRTEPEFVTRVPQDSYRER